MGILSRYVFREFLSPLFYCLVGFVSIYVLFDLFGSFSRMLEAHLPVGDAALYFCGYLAPYFHYLAPAALMLATLYTMWVFCRHSEIVAMRASGIGFLTIVRPLLFAAAAMAVVVAWVDECFMPRWSQWAAQLKTAKFESATIAKADNLVLRNAAAGRTWNVDEIRSPDCTRLGNVKVTVDGPGGARRLSVTAPEASYLDGEWWFVSTRVQHFDSLGREVATATPELDALPLRCFAEFDELPEDFLVQNRKWQYNSVRDRFRYLRTHPELTPERRADLLYDTWAQIMAPFACIVITLFAIPAGIASGRQSVFRGVLGALGMYFAFYGLDVGCMVAAKNAWLPPIPAAVAPHVVFFLLGARLFVRHR